MILINVISALQLLFKRGFQSLSVAGIALAGYFPLLGLGASGLAPWGLWLMSHEPPSLQAGSARRPSAGRAGGLVAGLRVGQSFGMFLLPGFGVGSPSPWVPGQPTSMGDSGIKWS